MSYAAARSSAAWIERSDRGVIRMHGRDPLRMIQGLVTNDVAKAEIDAAVYAAFLTPKGKMIGDARIVRRESGDIWIDADTNALENIAANLKKTVPPLYARCERLADVRVIGVYGPAAVDVNVDADVKLPTSYTGDAGFDYFVRGEISAPELSQITFDELETLRIEAASPRWGYELTEDVIPLEAGLRAAAISETKGCYTGQEVIVRILHRGHVNRHLRGLLLGKAPVPPRDAEVARAVDQKTVGKITSACASPLLQQTIAMGYIRREIEPGQTVLVNNHEARVVELPFQQQDHGGISRVRSA